MGVANGHVLGVFTAQETKTTVVEVSVEDTTRRCKINLTHFLLPRDKRHRVRLDNCSEYPRLKIERTLDTLDGLAAGRARSVNGFVTLSASGGLRAPQQTLAS
jgi:hypothetical protein